MKHKGIAEGLKEKGHDVKVVSGIKHGRGQIILKNEKGGYLWNRKKCVGHVAVFINKYLY